MNPPILFEVIGRYETAGTPELSRTLYGIRLQQVGCKLTCWPITVSREQWQQLKLGDRFELLQLVEKDP